MTDQNLTDQQVEQQLKDKKWQEVQVKGLSAWVNSYLIKEGVASVQKLPEDFQDAVKLCQFLNLVSPEGKKMEKFIAAPKQRIQKIENASKAIKYIQNDLGISLIGIGAEDIIDGNLKLTLGMLWSSFRKLAIGTIGGDNGKSGAKPEDDLLNWIRDMTQGYDGVNVVNFKNSFNDGLAWGALINRFNQDYLDFDELDKSSPENNLNRVFDIAESKLGIPKLFDAKELMSGHADERSVILYSSLFYHAWKTDYSKRQDIENKRRGAKEKVSELKSQLTAEEEELANLKAKREKALKDKSDKEKHLKDDMENKIKALEQKIEELRAERERLKKMLEDERNNRVKGAEKDSKNLKADKDRLQQQLEDARARKDKFGKMNVELLAENKSLREQLSKTGLSAVEGLEFGAADLSLMRGLLRDHVGMLHQQWKTIQDAEKDATERSAIRKERRELITEIKSVEDGVAKKKSIKDKNELLDGKFVGTGRTMVEILRVKDAINELCEFVDKKGYLMTQVDGGKRWKKRFFVLRGFFLSYYNKPEEMYDLAEGELNLENTTAVAKELKGNPSYGIRLRVKENDEKEELLVGAKTEADRDEWLAVIQGRIVYLQYLALMEQSSRRPDSRIVRMLSSQRLSAMNLDNRVLDGGVLKILRDFIEIHPELENLSFSNASLGDEEVTVLAEFLKFTPKLRSLVLSKNKISITGLSTVAKALSGVTSLHSLDLSNNLLGDGIGDLLAVFKANPELRTVDLSNNRIGDGSAGMLVEGLGGLPELNALKLSNNKFTNAGAVQLAKLIESHRSIEEVKLKSNSIGDEGAAAIFEALGQSKRVKSVDLAENEIGTKGVAALQKLFEKKKVVDVDLSGNRNLIGGKELSVLSNMADVEVPKLSFRQH